MSVRTTRQHETKKNKIHLTENKKNSVVGSEVSYIFIETTS